MQFVGIPNIQTTTEKREEREERSSEERTDGTEKGREREERGMQRRRREEAKHKLAPRFLPLFGLPSGDEREGRERAAEGNEGNEGMRIRIIL